MRPPKSVADEPAVLGLYTEDELAVLNANAQHWMTPAGVGDLERRAELDGLIVYQIVSDLATGRKVIPGRTGAGIMARAQRDYVALAENVLSILRKQEEGP